MKLTAQQIYERLITEEKILEVNGQIRFYLGTVDIIVKQRDVVGNIMQEWLEGWLRKNNIEYAPNENTQMPPDVYLDPEDKTRNLMEVKAFNYDATPGFDIADFNAYQQEIVEKPYMLHVKYLIFGYVMTNDGYVIIKKLWLKDVWNMCRPMAKWSLNLQVKEGVVHKIRPAKWYSKAKTNFKTFESLEDFISAIQEVVYQNPKTHNIAGTWLPNFISAYRKFYGKKLKVKRWSEIEDKYVLQ